MVPIMFSALSKSLLRHTQCGTVPHPPTWSRPPSALWSLGWIPVESPCLVSLREGSDCQDAALITCLLPAAPSCPHCCSGHTGLLARQMSPQGLCTCCRTPTPTPGTPAPQRAHLQGLGSEPSSQAASPPAADATPHTHLPSSPLPCFLTCTYASSTYGPLTCSVHCQPLPLE